MSSEINLRDDTKKLVLSILISAPRGRTVRELCSDFLEYMGYPIPFKEMGYLSVNEYFETNKDAFQLTWVKGELVVRGIADDSTEHIQRMVSRQRTPAKKSRVAAKKQTRNMMNKAGNHNAPSVSPFVRKCINELLLAYPDGILQTNFMAAYSRRFGQQLLFQKLGFASLRDLLKSLTNMLELVPLNNSGAYRVNLKKRSPSSSDKKMAASSSKRSVHGNNRSQQNGALTGPVSDGPNAGQVCNSSYTGPVSNSLRTGQVSNGPRAGPISNSSRMGPVSNSPATTKLPEDQNRNSSGTLHHSFKLSPHIPEEIQLNITKVLKKFQFGLCSNRMLREYKKINGQELPLAATGHVSVVEFLSELPHLVVITRPTKNGDWLLFEPEFYSQLENENAVDSAVRSTQQLDWRSIMKTIADRYPEGMPLRLLPDRFKAEVGVDLIPCDHQFTNLEDMIRSIDGKFVTIEQNSKCNILYRRTLTIRREIIAFRF
ncbi:tudor domain-containing protein 5-like [Tubulanus polymorphus]|uniref:tudor domain-containing protein 5-like n=1 Tax=Tubulanus polymorphus TaxID=672921 RepID=UPI003DA3067D